MNNRTLPISLIIFIGLILSFDLNFAVQDIPTTSIPGYAPVIIDPARIQLFGITTEKVAKRDLSKIIRTVGIVDVDERRVAHIHTKFSGWIENLYVNFVGMPVARNQPLFTVYSQDLYATQEEYLLALKDLDRPLTGRFASELKRASESLLKAARQRLELWDISAEQIKELEQNRTSSKTLTFRAPLDGIVLKKNAFIGMAVEPGMDVFTLADLSHVWVLADIYESDISFVKLNQKATITVSALPGRIFTAKAAFISYIVEASTRTAKVRFESHNPDFLLKSGMYATIEIKVSVGNVLAVLDDAVIDTGKRKIVFVSNGKGHFEPREVQLGHKAGSYYQVLSGLLAGEEVVTSSQFLLDSESRIKALQRTDMKEHGA